MNNEQVKLNISLDKTTPIVCDACGNETFTQVLLLRKASKFLTGTTQDALMPIPTFACAKCNHVNEEFQPKDQA
jgi:hypothetical protein